MRRRWPRSRSNSLAAIQEQGLDSECRLGLTLLGLKIDEDSCRDNVERIAAAARERGNFVRIDMEDYTCTDATLRPSPGPGAPRQLVVQAYMRRTLRDIADAARGLQGHPWSRGAAMKRHLSPSG